MENPKCFGKYDQTFPKQGRVCRACPVAMDCKTTVQTKEKPQKKKETIKK